MARHGPSEPKQISLDLTEDERRMLVWGLTDWGGPARCTESLAVAMGFEDLDDLEREADRIAEAIQAGEALTKRDWTRALFSTEVIFASDVIGTGSEWKSLIGGTDEHWLGVLRSLQRKLPKLRRFLGP